MTLLRNDAKGTRGVLLVTGDYEWIEPGETKSVPGHKIKSGIPDGLTEVDPKAAEIDTELPEQPDLDDLDDEDDIDDDSDDLGDADDADGADAGDAGEAKPDTEADAGDNADLQQLDHDGDGEPGGSKPHEPPALSGMDREALEKQAEIEGVDVSKVEGTGANGNVLVGDIRDAIEAKRKASAAAQS